MPRINQQKLRKATSQQQSLENIVTGKFKVANVRHPFARLYSGWRDKQRKIENYGIYKIYADASRPFWKPENPVPEGYRTSFESFAEYVAANPGNSAMNHHWTTIFALCSPCAIRYELITHLERSKEEIPKILELINLSELKIGGQYSSEGRKEIADDGKHHERQPDELHWSKIPRKTVEVLYRHFYLDFVIFGYSPEDVLK